MASSFVVPHGTVEGKIHFQARQNYGSLPIPKLSQLLTNTGTETTFLVLGLDDMKVLESPKKEKAEPNYKPRTCSDTLLFISHFQNLKLREDNKPVKVHKSITTKTLITQTPSRFQVLSRNFK